MNLSGPPEVGLQPVKTAVQTAQRPDGLSPVKSDVCRVADLYRSHHLDPEAHDRLELGAGWARRWTACWRVNGAEVVSLARDVGAVPTSLCQPVRRFTWRSGQRHRPGLQFVVSTGRHHGFESMAEQRLLLALDFARVRDVVPQPFRLRFAADGERHDHIPDFLAILPGGTWLFDVRPADRIRARDELCFAAAAEIALTAGWGYAVVSAWQPGVMTTLDTLSAQRRPLDDRLGLQPVLLALSSSGSRRFGELAAGTSCPAVARAHLLHLLWHRRLGVDLALPFGDRSLLWQAGGG